MILSDTELYFDVHTVGQYLTAAFVVVVVAFIWHMTLFLVECDKQRYCNIFGYSQITTFNARRGVRLIT